MSCHEAHEAPLGLGISQIIQWRNLIMNGSKKKRVIVVEAKKTLENPTYQKRLWLAARNMGISRREWPNIIADAIYNFDGDIMVGNGMRWPIPLVDDVLGDPRWFSYYFEEVEGKPRREVRLIERLRLLDLYFKIKHPNIARHFDK